MNNKKQDDLGLAGVKRLMEFLSIDSQWSIPINRGIAWWAKDFRQRIWAEESIVDGGTSLWRIHVATDFLVDFDLARSETRSWLGVMLPFATQYAWVHEQQTGHLRLWASLWVHAEVFEQRLRDLATSAVLQITDAQLRAPMLENQFDETADVSEHPTSGHRSVPDELLQVVTQVLAPAGENASAWDGTGEFEQTTDAFNERNSALGSADSSGLTLEFAFGNQTSMLRLLTDQENPQLGNGLLQLLHMPFSSSQEECLDLVMQLNWKETQELTRSPLLGSWCVSERGDEWIPVFVSFRSNALRKHGDVFDVTMGQALRAKWMSAKFAEEPDQPVATTVMSRLNKIFWK
jgi:hypothetical protein